MRIQIIYTIHNKLEQKTFTPEVPKLWYRSYLWRVAESLETIFFHCEKKTIHLVQRL